MKFSHIVQMDLPSLLWHQVEIGDREFDLVRQICYDPSQILNGELNFKLITISKKSTLFNNAYFERATGSSKETRISYRKHWRT